MPDLTRRRFLGLGTGIAAATWLSACGSDSAGSKSGSDSEIPTNITLDQLVERAKAEGSISYYALSQQSIDLFVPAFKAAYPWAKVSTFAATGSSLASKVILETKARVHNCDIVLHPPAQRQNYLNNKAIQPTPNLPDLNNVPEGLRDPDSYSLPTYQNPIVLAYNTKLITTPPPTDIYAYGDPSWKGKLVMERPQNLGLAAGFLASHRSAWGDAKWNDWLDALGKNDVLITENATSSYQAVLTGERSIGVIGLNDVLNQAKGAPVKACFYDGIAPLPVYFARITDCPHPFMAALFMSFAISTVGQAAVAKAGNIPILADIDAPTSINKVLPKGQDSQLPTSALATLYSKPDEYTTIFNKLWPA
jgi:iron(III) transport system substrate-binding protein